MDALIDIIVAGLSVAYGWQALGAMQLMARDVDSAREEA